MYTELIRILYTQFPLFLHLVLRMLRKLGLSASQEIAETTGEKKDRGVSAGIVTDQL